MKTRTMLVALPLALLAGQARAENWVTVATDTFHRVLDVDKDTIRRGSDGLVYFTAREAGDVKGKAVNCSTRASYLLVIDSSNGEHTDFPDWRQDDDFGPVAPNSMGAEELQYVCGNVP